MVPTPPAATAILMLLFERARSYACSTVESDSVSGVMIFLRVHCSVPCTYKRFIEKHLIVGLATGSVSSVKRIPMDISFILLSETHGSLHEMRVSAQDRCGHIGPRSGQLKVGCMRVPER